MATTLRFTPTFLLKALICSILLIFIVRLGFFCSQPKVAFLITTGLPVLYKSVSSKTPWESFLQSAQNAVPLQCHDHSNGKLHNTAKAVVINHPWCARWWLADQIAIGSLPHYLTKSLTIISSPGYRHHPRTIFLNKLGKNRVIFVKTKGKGQYSKVENAVQSVKKTNATLLVYAEGSHSLLYQHRDSPPMLSPFKTGVFRAIYNVDIPVIPVVLPLEWRPKTDPIPKIEILPPVYPQPHPTCQEFVDSVYNCMLSQLLKNKQKRLQHAR